MTSFALAGPALRRSSEAEVGAAAYNAYVLAFPRMSPDEAEKAGLAVIEQMLGVRTGPVVDSYHLRCKIARDERRARGAQH